MVERSEAESILARVLETETDVSRVQTSAVALLNRSEVEVQIDAAHRHERSIKTFLSQALTMATLSKSVAESCIYALPRADGIIRGPSVRLAEICASAYGNLQIGARVLDVEDKEIVAQGVAWDMQSNVRVTIEARRRIVGKNGRRYSDDMITMTGNAAASIALRNAIFRVVPRAYIDSIYERVRQVAVGDASTLDARRREVVVRLGKIGVPPDRVFLRLGKKAIEDVDIDDVEILIGLGTAVKNGELTIDEAFPPESQVSAAVAAAAPAAQQPPQAQAAQQAPAAQMLPEPTVTVPAAQASQTAQTEPARRIRMNRKPGSSPMQAPQAPQTASTNEFNGPVGVVQDGPGSTVNVTQQVRTPAATAPAPVAPKPAQDDPFGFHGAEDAETGEVFDREPGSDG